MASVTGDGCILGWVELAPRGYVCGDSLDLSPEAPWTEAPSTPPPAGFRGYHLAEHGASLPVGVVVAPSGAPVWQAQVPTRAIRFLANRTFVPILETKWAARARSGPMEARNLGAQNRAKVAPKAVKPQPEAYRVGKDEWISARYVRAIEAAPMPTGHRGDEKWIDIDLDTQTLCAYEGIVPVFATLVSTGVDAAPTPPGIYRIWKKLEAADVAVLPDGEASGSSAAVAWVQIFVPETGVSLRPRFARDRLGTKDGRGSVLLAPADAEWLYRWSHPAHAPGWSMSAGVIESPGTLIQLRSRQQPVPRLRGYAITVEEREQGY